MRGTSGDCMTERMGGGTHQQVRRLGQSRGTRGAACFGLRGHLHADRATQALALGVFLPGSITRCPEEYWGVGVY